MSQSFPIRPERAADDDTILALQMAAFGPGAAARAAFRVREQAPHDAALSFVLTEEEVILASVRQTHVQVGEDAGLLLGPLVVAPEHKNRGMGRALVRHALDAARAAGERFVILVGDRPYYAPLGFTECVGRTVRMPGPVDPARLLVAELKPGVAATLKGMVEGVAPALSAPRGTIAR
ncbi:MAG TPA: N-acetyltransferase [Afifellaceae bacterium]|nr:N-acetyltransferase [Afifellaceae bacterium]